MTLMEFTMIPLDKGASFSKYVARTLDIVDQSGLDYQLTPMGTVVEGEFSDLLVLLEKRCNLFCSLAGSPRLVLILLCQSLSARRGRDRSSNLVQRIILEVANVFCELLPEGILFKDRASRALRSCFCCEFSGTAN